MPIPEVWTFSTSIGEVLDFNSSPYTVIDHGGFGMLPVEVEQTPKARDGSTVRNVRRGARLMLLEVLIAPLDANDAPAANDRLARILNSVGRGELVEGTLRWERFDDSVIEVVCSLRRGLSDVPRERLSATWKRRVILEFVSRNPNLRGPQQTATMMLDHNARTPLPARLPLKLGWRDYITTANFDIGYMGTADTETLQWEIDGYCDNPVIINTSLTPRRYIRFNGIVPPDSTLVVKMDGGDGGGLTATLDDDTNWFPFMNVNSLEVPLLAAQSNLIVVGAVDGMPETRLSWYEEFLSA